MNGFILSQSDNLKLNQIDKRLADVVRRAAEITTQPFKVLEGLRTKERQRWLYSKGKTKTLNSNHITGFAVDLVPLVSGNVSWDWKYYYALAEAMDDAADELYIPLTWGSAWNGTTEDWDDARKAQELYKRIKRAQGKNPFLDGPHWEIPRRNQGTVYISNDKNINIREMVSDLQKLVNKYGEDIEVDGIWGPITNQALLSFIKKIKG